MTAVAPWIVGLSDIVVDVYLAANRLPQLGEKVLVEALGKMAGGMVPNAMCAASRLGARTSVIGRVGNDPDGRLALEDLRRMGVGVSRVRHTNGLTTGWTAVVLTPSGERVIYVADGGRGEARDWELNKQELGLIRQADALYLTPYMGERLLFQAVDAARDAGSLVAMDIERTQFEVLPDPWRVLKACDVVFLNDEACRWLEAQSGVSPDRLLEYVAGLGTACVVRTRGAHGAMALVNGERVESPGFPVHVRDATGAGDCFNATFLTLVLNGRSPEEALCLADAAGALSVTAVGPRGHLPTLEEILDFVRKGRGVSPSEGGC